MEDSPSVLAIVNIYDGVTSGVSCSLVVLVLRVDLTLAVFGGEALTPPRQPLVAKCYKYVI